MGSAEVDTQDFAILGAIAHGGSFQWNVRVSYADIARAVGADEETTRARIRRLQDDGIILGWSVSMNPALFGRQFYRVDLGQVPDAERPRVLPALEALDGAKLLFEYYGGRFALAIVAPPPPALDRHLTLLRALTGAAPQAHRMEFPPVEGDLTPLDWRIARTLRAGVRRPYAELAEEVGVSERTLRRRIERMVESRAIYLECRVDLGKVSGLVPCTLTVSYADPRERAADATLRAMPGRVFGWFEGPVSRVSFPAKNLAEAEALRARVAAMPGVAAARLDAQLAVTTLDRWMDEEIERRAAGVAAR